MVGEAVYTGLRDKKVDMKIFLSHLAKLSQLESGSCDSWYESRDKLPGTAGRASDLARHDSSGAGPVQARPLGHRHESEHTAHYMPWLRAGLPQLHHLYQHTGGQ
jgi:hypothetical protein